MGMSTQGFEYWVVTHSLNGISLLAYLFVSTASYGDALFTDRPPGIAPEKQEVTVLLFPGFKVSSFLEKLQPLSRLPLFHCYLQWKKGAGPGYLRQLSHVQNTHHHGLIHQ